MVRIIDGDTVEVSDGRHIRYIGIDTPEAGDCYATAAAELNRQLVLDKKVKENSWQIRLTSQAANQGHEQRLGLCSECSPREASGFERARE